MSVDHIAQTERRYTVALQHYLSEPDERTLLLAYEVGRGALADGLGVLDMATIHAHALSVVLNDAVSKDEKAQVIEAETDFFTEALSPFEMAHRAFREANTVLRRLNDMLEGQAKRIAYALHDEASQLLVSVHLMIVEAAKDLPREKEKQLTKIRGVLDQIEERLRNLSHELRPPVLEDLGLFPALELLADGVSKRWGLPVTVTTSINANVPQAIETTVYRITQEALTNAAKHARATKADVDLRLTGHNIICSVRDDGIGLAASAASARKTAPGLGLIEISERVAALGGVMRIASPDDRGTELTIEIPLEA